MEEVSSNTNTFLTALMENLDISAFWNEISGAIPFIVMLVIFGFSLYVLIKVIKQSYDDHHLWKL